MSIVETGVELSLDLKNARSSQDFVNPSQRHLGDEPEIEFEPFRFRIGDRPVVRDLRRLYELSDREVPADLEIFHDNDIWIIEYSVSVVGNAMMKQVREVAFQIRYPDRPRVTILEVMPRTQFIEKVGAELRSEADIDIWGRASIPTAVTELLDAVESVGAGGKIQLASKLNVVGRLSFAVVTPLIVATGYGDSGGEWIFQKDKEPLLGDLRMLHIVHTPRFQKKLLPKAQVSATIATSWLFPMRLESDWVKMSCSLK